MIELFAVNDQFLVTVKLLRFFEDFKKPVKLLIILKEVPREHIMAGRHPVLMGLLSQSLCTGLSPSPIMGELKEPDHPVAEVINTGDQLVGRLDACLPGPQP